MADSAAKAAPKPTTGQAVKETIESILIAFVLAFVFRAFVVEAFVIPTGSMATTLLGAHYRFTCPDCGREFTANFAPDPRDRNYIPSLSGPWPPQDPRYDTVISVHCDNCGLKIPREMATNKPVHYGDRILVLKYLYLLERPQRWDVVVFKNPVRDQENLDYSQNYIKRLIGRPGEQIMLLDGNVYAAPSEDQKPEIASRAWQIQAKPHVVQEALWRLVYDNDFLPQRPKWVQPWQPQGEGWTAGRRRVFTFDSAGGEGTLAFNPNALTGTPQTSWHPFTDALPYDETGQQHPGIDHYRENAYASQVPSWTVSDLKVRFFYDRKDGDGALRVSLTKLGRTFVAEIGPAQARLLDGQTELARCDVPRTGAPLQVEFSNVDYGVTLRLNDQIALQTTPQQYAPDIPDLLKRYENTANGSSEKWESQFPRPSVSISAARQSASISHLSLWRDVFYTPRGSDRSLLRASPDNPVILGRKGERGPGSDDEYFVCGDNSILSFDARLWERNSEVDLLRDEDLRVDAGRVPGRFMIGKALFVYWPAGYRPVSDSAPGLVPNFGKMRFIH